MPKHSVHSFFIGFLIILIIFGIDIKAQEFSTQGSATLIGPNTYRLTPPMMSQAGLITNYYPLTLTQNFTLNFELNFGNLDDFGADGFAFTLSRNCTPSLGIGSGIGIDATTQTLIVELDDFNNYPAKTHDIPADHVGIYANGDLSNLAGSVMDGNPSLAPCILPNCGNVEDGLWHQVEIRWEYLSATSQRLTVFFDGNQRAVSTRNHIQNIFQGATIAFWSVSSSSGLYYNDQQFRMPVTNTSRCEGERFTLTAPPLGSNYSWNNGSASNTNTAVFVAQNPGTTTYSCSYTDFCGSARTINFVTDIKPLSRNSINRTICEGESFLGFSATGIYRDTLRGAAANGCDSIQIVNLTVNPRKRTTISRSICEGDSFEGYSISGVYRDTFSVAGSCDSIRTLNLTVSLLPQPLVTVTPPDCLVRTGAISIAPISGALYSYNNGIFDNITTFSDLQPGTTHTIQLRNANGCLSEVKQITIPTAPVIPSGSISSANNIICAGTPTLLTATGGASYQWFFNANPIVQATGSSYQATLPGNYALDIFSADGCRIRVPGPTLTYIQKPEAAFSAPNGCVFNTIRFNNLSQVSLSGSVSYTWQFGSGIISTQENPFYTYTAKGLYTTTLKVVSNLCPQLSDTASASILIDAPIPGIRYPSLNLIPGAGIRLNARNFGSSYRWFPPVGISSATTVSPVFTGNDETDYIIEITTPSGCITYDSLLVRIFTAADIQVPKAFTPNGDGHNDKLDVFLIGIKELRFFKVFNRWGQLMYETNNALQLWDGIYRGSMQPLETYVWIAEGVADDGRIIRKRGQTVLIR